jgi:hypothetical protein
MPTFDGDNLRIILDSGVTSVDVEIDLYSDWKEWSQLSDNAKYPAAFRTVGGDALTPGIDAGAYFFIQNQSGWRIRPPEENITILVNGNLAPEESTLPILVPTLGNFSVLVDGLQPITQNVDTILTSVQESLYAGHVFVDTLAGVPGTTFPIGTDSEPVSNLVDAVTIANDIGVRAMRFNGVLILDRSFQFWDFIGASAVAIVNVAGQDISGARFQGVEITGACGTLTNDFAVLRSKVNGLTGIRGAFGECVMQGTMSMVGDVVLGGCASNVSGSSTPIFECQSHAMDFSVRGWIGGIELRNFDQPGNNASLVASTVTDGTIVIRGVGTCNDNSSGATIIDDGFIDGLDVTRLRNHAIATSLIDTQAVGGWVERRYELSATPPDTVETETYNLYDQDGNRITAANSPLTDSNILIAERRRN